MTAAMEIAPEGATALGPGGGDVLRCRSSRRDDRAEGGAARGTGAESRLPASTTWLMGAACGLTAGNLYYNQPLLADIQAALRAGTSAVGWIPTSTQLGYAAAMLTLVPLGDRFERKGLVVGMMAAAAAALWTFSCSMGAGFAAAASFLVGLCSVAPQLLLPFASELAAPSERGRAVGTVMSGLLLGILLARVAAGALGAALGWRAVFRLAALAMLGLAALLRAALPESEPTFRGGYGELFASSWTLVRESPELRESAFIGAMLFACFSAFWATLVFLLKGPPFGYGAREAGLFGLLGAAGALGAAVAGRLADRDARRPIGAAIGVLAVSFFVFARSAASLRGLILGTVLMDWGVQSGHICCQARVLGLIPEARSRLNMIYMSSYFLGGALGSWTGAWAFERAGWGGVCAAGLVFSALAAAAYLRPRTSAA